MAKSVDDSVLDAAHNEVRNNGNQQLVCAGEPANRAEAISNALMTMAMVPGDYTIADGDVSGRKITVAQKADVNIDVSGTADHVAIISATTLLRVTTCPAVTLNMGLTATVASYKAEIEDPS